MVGRWAVLCLPMLVGLGCAQARLVQRDANGGGIVAIPKNSNSWPYHYHRQAEELIAKQCPGGYVIEREQEVVTGQVTTTNTNTERHGVPVLAAVGLGPTYEDQATTTSATNVTEWRIWFRPKGAAPSSDLPPSGLAPAGGVIPASGAKVSAIAPR